MITEQDISDYFTTHIDMMRLVARGVAYKNGRSIHEDVVISECYIYCYNNIKKINTKLDLRKFSIQWINQNLIWTNSQLNIKNGCHSLEHNDFFYQQEDELDLALENKIEIEKWYNEKIYILNSYRIQEKDLIKQIIFDVYFKKKIIKGLDVAKHLNINKDLASRYIRELKADIYDYYLEYNNK